MCLLPVLIVIVGVVIGTALASQDVWVCVCVSVVDEMRPHLHARDRAEEQHHANNADGANSMPHNTPPPLSMFNLFMLVAYLYMLAVSVYMSLLRSPDELNTLGEIAMLCYDVVRV